MTRKEAEDILTSVGCIDPRNLAAAHVALCHWIDRHGRGETPWKNVDEAFQRLRQIDPPPEQEQQQSLFAEKRADL